MSGNLTVIKDGETSIDRESIRDYFERYVYFDGMPGFDVIICGNSSPNLSTHTKTELGFIADPTSDYLPPNIAISVVDSDLYNCVTGGDVKLNLTVNDETSISSVNLKYSIDDGSTWDEVSLMQINGNKWMANIVDLNDSYVSIMANATDSIGNSISQTVIRGFYVSAAEECTPPNRSWNITISAANQLEPVTVGMHPNASDGYDVFDVFAQIPVQGKVILLLDEIYSKSVKQTRCYNESVSWNLSVGVPSGQTTILSWNIPLNVNLTIYEGNTILNSGVQLSEGSHNLLVIAELMEKQTFSLNLNAGWNMISLPLIPDNCSVHAIFGSIPTLETMPVVTWKSPSFVEVERIEPKIGYWVFTPTDTTINVTGNPIDNTTLILEAGWNMVGTVGLDNLTISDIPNQVPQRPAVTWVAPSFVETDVIEPGKSAWVFVTTDTSVTVGESVSTKMKAKVVPMVTKMESMVVAATTDEWDLTISAASQLEPVTFGIHPSATDGYDEYDVFSQTPVQGKVIMVLDDIYATEINRNKPIWHLGVGVPAGQTTTLAWDSSKIPADVSLALDGIDMKLQDSMELGEGSHSFVINAEENMPPIANFTFAPLNPVSNQTITFNASSSCDLDGDITNYEWDFGDGNITTTTERITTHFYASEGDYNVNLTVTDDDGAINSTSKTITIKPLRGDLNSDGNVTSADVLIALQIAVSGEYVPEADIDGNGCVNALDARMIMQAAAGRIEL